MSWIQKLYDTYECAAAEKKYSRTELWPEAHFLKKAHVEVVITAGGKFRRARTLSRAELATLIPVTEASLGRAGAKIAPHPLCDEVSYCAADYPEADLRKFESYINNLRDWCTSDYSHQKAKAVLAYLVQRRLWSDLNNEALLPVVIAAVPGKAKEVVQNQKIFVRWRIESGDTPATGTWEDESLIQAWCSYDKAVNPADGVCMVLGEQSRICKNHPKFIRRSDDGAKIISANDSSGFVFRGRFTDDTGLQASSVGYQVTQKAHNALRWLIQRQAYRNGDQVIVSWAVGGAPIPDPFANTFSLLQDDGQDGAPSQIHLDADAGQAFALRLKQRLRGYNAQLGATEDIVVMGLDSATPGRMAITYYRELTGSEFLDRLEQWHGDHAWHQFFGKDRRFVGAPAPHDIAEVAYGQRVDDKLKKSVVERLLPSIVDGQLVPRDLVDSVVRRVCNRVGQKHWEWEKGLGIACGLFRGFNKGKDYQMGLETDRRSRDYLYGRLLAVAERIESMAIYVGGEGRDTAAAKLMQRFADRPASTWRTIELALAPAKSRLRAKRGGPMHLLDKLHDDIVAMFQGDDFMDDRKLSGEFLLGYHCQRRELMPRTSTDSDESADPTTDQ